VRDAAALLPPLDHVNALTATSTNNAQLEWVSSVRGQMDGVDQRLSNLSARVSGTANASASETRTYVSNVQWSILALSLLAILLSLGLAVLFTRNTIRPILRLRAHMARVATGDLTPPAWRATASGDELETLEAEYQRTLDRLGPLIRQIQEDASHISSSAAEISAAATQQASGSSEQAAAITEVTVTVEELNQTAVQIAEAAGSVAAAAEQALVSANRGQDAVRDSILGMAMIKSRVNDITARILALSEQSQEIGEVIEVINQIAARTHILALNAAVESAGAGQQGLRFGVVAAEVKKLAQRSVAATKEVRTLIAEIQAATAAAVMATEEGLKETDRGVGLAHQSGDANEDIISMVERTAQLANAISLATQQQRTASEQVVATMREVAEVTRQAAVSSRQAAAAAGQLSGIAGELRGASQGFRLESAALGGAPVPPAPGDKAARLPLPAGEPA
jgi:methyl-accepting chemotaxis protein